MKGISPIILFLLGFVLVVSCKKKMDTGTDDKNLVMEVTRLSNIEAQKIAYRSLTAEQKVFLWKTHLEEATGVLRVDVARREHIAAIMQQLRPEIFASAAASDAFLHSDFMMDWKARAKELFTEEHIIYLFAQINTNPAAVSGNVASVQDVFEASTCNCSTSSDFCGRVLTVCGTQTTETGTMPLMCMKKSKCSNAVSCVVNDIGCGWFFLETCGGSCLV
jgi:hypothetical protein